MSQHTYKDSFPKLGVALIFIQTELNFEYISDILQHYDRLLEILLKFGFDVRVHKNLNFTQTWDVLSSVAKEDHEENTCFLGMFISKVTHGKIHTRDILFQIDDALLNFCEDSCKTLANKPKLFFIQNVNYSNPLIITPEGDKTTCDARPTHHHRVAQPVPSKSDFLVMYSETKGICGQFTNVDGVFIESLCEELESALTSKSEVDFGNLLTWVNGRVSEKYENLLPEYLRKHSVQTCATISTLRKSFILKKTPMSESIEGP